MQQGLQSDVVTELCYIHVPGLDERTKSHITNIFRVYESGISTQLQWWLACAVHDLRSMLNTGLSSSIYEFLCKLQTT
jgi:hypothetical protein